MAASGVRAAVPAYLGQDFRDAAPGHRFFLYLSVWNGGWGKVDDKAQTLDLASLGDDDRRRMKALAERQAALAGDDCFTLPARSLAPFTTGLGIEHPLENGFAFLSPFGLPYLPGSSVKGVLRRAALELGDGELFEHADRTWTEADIGALFGAAGERAGEQRQRGALVFWDVHPVLPERCDLQWEIMTPHQKGYYQDGEPPHDNGSPIPILFLTLPPGTRFRFHVQCDRTLLERIAPRLLEGDVWRAVLRELFEHAFAWIGFGAKTSVGYGEMRLDDEALSEIEEAREAAAREAEERRRLERLDPEERLAEELLKHKTDSSMPDHKYLLGLLQSDKVEDAGERRVVARQALARLEAQREDAQRNKKGKARKRALERLEQDAAALRTFLEE